MPEDKMPENEKPDKMPEDKMTDNPYPNPYPVAGHTLTVPLSLSFSMHTPSFYLSTYTLSLALYIHSLSLSLHRHTPSLYLSTYTPLSLSISLRISP